MHHPHSYLGLLQLAEDRRRDLEQARRAASAQALERSPRRAAWRRALHSVRRLVTQPAT